MAWSDLCLLGTRKGTRSGSRQRTNPRMSQWTLQICWEFFNLTGEYILRHFLYLTIFRGLPTLIPFLYAKGFYTSVSRRKPSWLRTGLPLHLRPQSQSINIYETLGSTFLKYPALLWWRRIGVPPVVLSGPNMSYTERPNRTCTITTTEHKGNLSTRPYTSYTSVDLSLLVRCPGPKKHLFSRPCDH